MEKKAIDPPNETNICRATNAAVDGQGTGDECGGLWFDDHQES